MKIAMEDLHEMTMERWNLNRSFDRDEEFRKLWVPGADERIQGNSLLIHNADDMTTASTLDSTLVHLKELAILRSLELEEQDWMEYGDGNTSN